MGGGGDQKAQEELESRSPCSFGAVGGATDVDIDINVYTKADLVSRFSLEQEQLRTTMPSSMLL